MKVSYAVVLAGLSVFASGYAAAATDVPVPSSCTAQVNSQLAGIIDSRPRESVDNVMVCGVAIRNSRTQAGGPHGDHQVLALKIMLPSGQSSVVEVVTNDDLDGKVTAKTGDTVYAFGQAFVPRRGQYAAGVHDVHCATHRGADNGWVVVSGVRYPGSCSR